MSLADGRPLTREDPAGRLAVARALALYLLGLHAVTSGLLAWNPGRLRDPVTVAALVLILAAAQVIGQSLAPRLADFPERRRLRVVGVTTYAAVVVVGVLARLGTSNPRVLAREAELFAGLQAILPVLSGLSRGDLGALQNAFVLVILAALRGGPVAAVAVTGWLVLVVFFLAFDHFARQVGAYPTARVALVGVAFRLALVRAICLVASLAGLFALAPPTPHGRLVWSYAPPDVSQSDLVEAYGRLLFLALSAAGLLWMIGRLLRRRDRKGKVEDERLQPSVGAEEPLSEPVSGKPTYAGVRGRIVRAYVGFLRDAQRLGFRRRPSQTAAEFAAQLHPPAPAVRSLTDLFVAARYGPEEPSEAAADAADQAAQAGLAELRARRRGLTTGRPAA